jgi:GTPase SAR1 family protein
MIVGNKCDLNESRVVATDRGEHISMQHAVPFMETSAKTNLNIAEAFREISLRILEKVKESSSFFLKEFVFI